MQTGDAQSRHDEAWGRGPGTASDIERAAELARHIDTCGELLAKPDWYFGGRADAVRARLRTEREEFTATLAEIEARIALQLDATAAGRPFVMAAE